MNTPETILQVNAWLNPILLGICGFLLRSLYTRFAELEKEVRQSLIDGASISQKIISLEKDIENLKHIVFNAILPHKISQ